MLAVVVACIHFLDARAGPPPVAILRLELARHYVRRTASDRKRLAVVLASENDSGLRIDRSVVVQGIWSDGHPTYMLAAHTAVPLGGLATSSALVRILACVHIQLVVAPEILNDDLLGPSQASATLAAVGLAAVGLVGLCTGSLACSQLHYSCCWHCRHQHWQLMVAGSYLRH